MSFLIEGRAIIRIQSCLPAFLIGKQCEAHRTKIVGSHTAVSYFLKEDMYDILYET